jgi:tetratricopeptide (TPR) repeat protein
MENVAREPSDLLARAYEAAGGISYWRADTHAAHHYYGKALDEARKSGDKRLTARALYNLSFAALDEPRPSREGYAAGKEFLEQSLEMFRELGDRQGIADALWALAIAIPAAKNDVYEALTRVEEALELYRELDNPFGVGWSSYLLATLNFNINRLDAVQTHLGHALEWFTKAGDRSAIVLIIAGYALLADKHGDREGFYRLAGAAERLAEETGSSLVDAPVEFLDYTLPERPKDAEGQRLWAEGRQMTADEAIAYVRREAASAT